MVPSSSGTVRTGRTKFKEMERSRDNARPTKKVSGLYAEEKIGDEVKKKGSTSETAIQVAFALQPATGQDLSEIEGAMNELAALGAEIQSDD